MKLHAVEKVLMNGSMHKPLSTAPTKSSLYEFSSGRGEKKDRLLGVRPFILPTSASQT